MIQQKDLFSIPFYDKTYFSGSYQGMRYRLEKITSEEEACLLASCWPGPYCYTATEDDKKKTNTFEYSEAGISLAWQLVKSDLYRERSTLLLRHNIITSWRRTILYSS